MMQLVSFTITAIDDTANDFNLEGIASCFE
jgi:hypothetical protein